MAIKLSQWAKKHNLTYAGAFNLYKKFGIPGAFTLPSGSIFIEENIISSKKIEKVAVYARVSKDKEDLEGQVKRVSDFCEANGWEVSVIKAEVASNLNERRKGLLELFSDKDLTKIVVESKDVLTRYGFWYIKEYLNSFGCDILILKTEDDE